MLLAPVSLALALSAPTEGKVVAASLFKNGYAVVVREADLDANGKAALKPPAGAVMGTLWISASEGAQLQKATFTRIESSGQRDVQNLDELLSANLEKNVILETNSAYQGQSTVVKGRIISSVGPMVVLEGDNDRIALFKSSIVRVVAAEHGLNFRVPDPKSDSVIEVVAKNKGKVYMVSLQRGMTWSPAYQISLLDEKRLRIIGKATIMNDLTALEDVDVNLVTGFPNIRFLNITDPLSSGQSVADYVQSLAYVATNPEYRRDAIQNQAPGGFGGGGFAPSEQMQPTGSGAQLEDLFLYKQPHVSLKVGERGAFVVLDAQADYTQEYEVQIPDIDWNNPRPVGGSFAPEPLDVWHTLKFKNTTGQPLTTGPAMTVKKEQVLGQDLINYTSAGAEAKVRVTKALDIHVETLDEEVTRERGALKIENRATYDRVTVKGTIELVNTKPKSVTMRVEKTATGDVLDGGGAYLKKTPAGLRQINPVTQLVWKPVLEPNKPLRLSYTVSVLVPSGGY